jgi:hypothetical protein
MHSYKRADTREYALGCYVSTILTHFSGLDNVLVCAAHTFEPERRFLRAMSIRQIRLSSRGTAFSTRCSASSLRSDIFSACCHHRQTMRR